METMETIRRYTLHLVVADMRALERLARQEAKATGIRVTSAGIVRRLIKEYLAQKGGGGR